ncbi:MAG: peptidase, partial [Proteobacteria bacterium]|nr:peptidase [Pseudomonadota bacterium]
MMKNRIMLSRFIILLTFLFMFLLNTGVMAGEQKCGPIIKNKAPREDVEEQINKLTPILIAPDYTYLPANEQEVIHYLVKASRIIDNIFLEQVSKNNRRMLRALKEYIGTPDQVYYDYFKIMYGPWDRLNNNAPFINLDEQKPPGVNYYPPDLTQEEFESWINAHPHDEEDFTSPFTVIKRRWYHLKAVPYTREYRTKLRRAARLLRKAARLTSDPTLAAYLKSRATAFFTNDYRQSDIDWIGLDGDIELVFGPYETYEDELLGFKAAFESFVCLVDRDESEKLQIIETFRE